MMSVSRLMLILKKKSNRKHRERFDGIQVFMVLFQIGLSFNLNNYRRAGQQGSRTTTIGHPPINSRMRRCVSIRSSLNRCI